MPLERILYILPGLSKLALCIFIALINFYYLEKVNIYLFAEGETGRPASYLPSVCIHSLDTYLESLKGILQFSDTIDKMCALEVLCNNINLSLKLWKNNLRTKRDYGERRSKYHPIYNSFVLE